MSDIEIDFENPVGKYELRAATSKEIQESRAGNPQITRGVPEGDWPFHLGWIVRVGSAKEVRPSAEKMQWAVRLLVERKRVRVPFHEVVLKIVRAIGTDMPDKEPMAYWSYMAERLQWIFEGKDFVYQEGNFFGPKKEVRWPHPAAQRVGDLGIYLVPNKDGKRVLALRPDNLRDALTLYAARMRATGTTFNTCEYCRAPFMTGGAGLTNKRRGDARFCSDKCRYSHHNEARRKIDRS
jgi:hypothetical protein